MVECSLGERTSVYCLGLYPTAACLARGNQLPQKWTLVQQIFFFLNATFLIAEYIKVNSGFCGHIHFVFHRRKSSVLRLLLILMISFKPSLFCCHLALRMAIIYLVGFESNKKQDFLPFSRFLLLFIYSVHIALQALRNGLSYLGVNVYTFLK